MLFESPLYSVVAYLFGSSPPGEEQVRFKVSRFEFLGTKRLEASFFRLEKIPKGTSGLETSGLETSSSAGAWESHILVESARYGMPRSE